MTKFKYSEDIIIKQLYDYVESTYGAHYAGEKIQTTEYIMSQFTDGADFLRGNALKYLSRYGLKEGKNKRDLLKAVHYIILMLHYDFEKENANDDNKNPKKD